MIELTARREQAADPPDEWLRPLYCARCQKRLGDFYLTAGSAGAIRCHHSIKVDEHGVKLADDAREYDKRVTCGYRNRFSPTR